VPEATLGLKISPVACTHRCPEIMPHLPERQSAPVTLRRGDRGGRYFGVPISSRPNDNAERLGFTMPCFTEPNRKSGRQDLNLQPLDRQPLPAGLKRNRPKGLKPREFMRDNAARANVQTCVPLTGLMRFLHSYPVNSCNAHRCPRINNHTMPPPAPRRRPASIRWLVYLLATDSGHGAGFNHAGRSPR